MIPGVSVRGVEVAEPAAREGHRFGGRMEAGCKTLSVGEEGGHGPVDVGPKRGEPDLPVGETVIFPAPPVYLC